MSEHFSAWIQNRTEFEKGNPAGIWLDLPATKEQLHEAMKALKISAANPQDFRLHGHFVSDSKKVEIPLDLLQEPDFDTLNFLAAQLDTLDPAQLEKLNALCKSDFCPQDLKRFLDYPANADCFVFIPGVLNYEDLGDYYLNDSGMVQMPELWKAGIDKEVFGRNAAAYEQGYFTEQGYILTSGDEWQPDFEEKGVPDKYRVMSYPEPERPAPEKIEKDAAPAPANTKPGVQFNPTRPIELKAEKPAEKMKEITDRLEQGIQELFDSDRYKEYLKVMSKFHNYSVNNTLLIAMQKPDATLIAGYNSWKSIFGRQVVKGAKGIKVIAPSPFKVKKEMEKIDPHTQKPIIGINGKPVKQEVEITVPAFKVVSVFDVSQTEGRELPSIGVDELTGSVEKYNDYFKALTQASPSPVGFEKIEGGAHGYYHLEEKRIAINEGMSELQNLKTLIHEIAHAKLHDVDLKAPAKELENRPDRRTREVQAESIAYAVCQHYGLDTSDYSFGYVAGWSSGRELSELQASLETIRSAASELIKDIDKNFAELTQSKEQTQTNEAAKTEKAPEQTKAPKKKQTRKQPAASKQDKPKNTPQKAKTEKKNTAKKEEAVLPDPAISVKDMQEYGYTWDGMLPLQAEAATRFFEQGKVELFCLYNDGTEGAVTSLEDLQAHAKHDGIFGMEKEAWERVQNTPPNKESTEPDKSTFTIYQLKDNAPREYHFRPLNELQEKGLSVIPANYKNIYTAPLAPDMTLEDIYQIFNQYDKRPQDFKGHSLSVSDVVVLHQSGRDTAHYVDSFGFSDVTQTFQKENPLEAAEKSTEQNYNIIDGQINNTPTVDELEARVKAGEQISLTELAAATKKDKAAAQMEAKKPGRKPSIRKQLKEDKEKAKAAPKKHTTRAKTQEAERS